MVAIMKLSIPAVLLACAIEQALATPGNPGPARRSDNGAGIGVTESGLRSRDPMSQKLFWQKKQRNELLQLIRRDINEDVAERDLDTRQFRSSKQIMQRNQRDAAKQLIMRDLIDDLAERDLSPRESQFQKLYMAYLKKKYGKRLVGHDESQDISERDLQLIYARYLDAMEEDED